MNNYITDFFCVQQHDSVSGNQQFRIGYCKQTIAHTLCGLLLELHLRVTVSTFEKRCISVTGEVCDRIFVHAFVQKRRDEEMPERVQVIGFRQTDFREQGFQVLAERVRVDGCAVVFRENVFREWDIGWRTDRSRSRMERC